MNFKKLSFSCVLALAGLMSANAATISVDAARMAANDFLKKNIAAKGMFHAPSMADLKLAHAEASSVEGNAYYVFNIQGGGWVIIAGDDRAKQVLAYGDKGNIDMNDMPGGMMGFLKEYKQQIEAAQAYEGKMVPKKTYTRTTVVNPLLKTNWGQGEPLNRLCPLNNSGKRTSVGCGPLAMAQIIYYWKYPNEIGDLSGYSISWSQYMQGLPGTTFDFDTIIESYHIYNPETGEISLGTFTEEQASEVAKLARYCGQACKAKYGDGEGGTATGSYTYDQRDAFFTFGYNSDAKLIGKDPSYYCYNYPNKYTDDEWAALIYTELEAGRPIPYHDMWEGHAWVLDGVDADGRFHMNWGFYGKFNGWFEINALAIHPYDDDEIWDFSYGNNGYNEMIIGMYPYEGYVIPGDEPDDKIGDVNKDGKVTISDVTALIDYLLSGDASAINLDAADVNGQGGITIADVTALIDLLLSGNGD